MKNLFDDFFTGGLISLEKNFSVDPIWKEEINKWLICVEEIDYAYYERAKTRVKQDIQKQEETLAEIRSIYFLKEIKNCVISKLEPDRVDLSFSDESGINWLAEVKCPSYVKEIFENNPTKEESLERKKQPKNINETFAFDFRSGYTDAIKNSLDKFKKGDNNILIISDDRFVPLTDDPFAKENIMAELQQQDIEGKISSVLLLTVRCNIDNKFNYISRIITVSKELFPEQV
jgi:hypothetical protein